VLQSTDTRLARRHVEVLDQDEGFAHETHECRSRRLLPTQTPFVTIMKTLITMSLSRVAGVIKKFIYFYFFQILDAHKTNLANQETSPKTRQTQDYKIEADVMTVGLPYTSV